MGNICICSGHLTRVVAKATPHALATDRVLGLLSRNLNSSKLSQQLETRSTSGENPSDGARQKPAKEVNNQGNLAS